MIKVYIVDDHKMIRDGLKAIIKHFNNINVIGDTDDGNLVLELLKKSLEVDVFLIDVNMPLINGIDLTKSILKLYPSTKIIALSMNRDYYSVSKMISAGASGYILKDAGEDILESSINTIYNGETYFSSEVTEIIMGNLTKKKVSENKTKFSQNQLVELSAREIEILNHIAEGYTNKEIGEMLFISPRTADSHRRNLLLKTGAKNSVSLAKIAFEKKYKAI